MSHTITTCAWVAEHPQVNPTTTGRVKIRFGETAVTLDLDHARALMQDIEGALARLAYRQRLDEANHAAISIEALAPIPREE